MHRVAVVAFLAITVVCSSKGDSSQGGGGSGGAATGGAIRSGGQTASNGGAIGGDGQTAGTGGSSGSGGKSGGSGGVTGIGGMTGSDGGTSAHTNPLSQAMIDEFVTAHNQARSGTLNPPPSPPLPPVSWDPILADSAYNYLAKCPSSGSSMVGHNANRTSDYAVLGGRGYVGENIYAMQGAAATPTAAVAQWMSEASSYHYATNTGNAGHYSQVVWRDSVRIGCAIINCSAMKYTNTILCDYSPGGNISGKKPY